MTIEVAFRKTMNTIQVLNSKFGSRVPGWSYEKHYHPYCELLHCREGEIQLELDGHPLVLRRGDWLIIKSHVKHRLWNGSAQPYYFFHCHFDIDDHGLRQLLYAEPYKHVSVLTESDGFPSFLSDIGYRLEGLMHSHIPESAKHMHLTNYFFKHLSLQGRLMMQAYVTLAIAEMVALQPGNSAPFGDESAAAQYSSRMEVEMAHKIERMLEEHIRTNVTITDLAGRLGLSRTQFTKIFTRVYGISPRQFVSRQKLNMAKTMIVNSDEPIGAIANQLGFSNINHFSRQFRRWVGKPPSHYRPKYKLDVPKPESAPT
ncbi:helix-turn-helix domain-containing protein [Paenibacillus ginsengarvi]|uniref:AraC family transcriptional regulator n=1 Tax=Paenibacillus ginsengarvi TaxID=400777 RepID=A0A3B0BX08_9BACL|nr:AraC family transcriptional regulator [Paenibacillus ginsengarvi]RKN75986.1 AraC family transcriptional regulator [Paenibacillus ginsengarvi]